MARQSHNASEDLVEDALALLARTRDMADHPRAALLADWRRRSPEHAEALDAAAEEWALFGEIADAPLNWSQRIQLSTQALIASSADNPARTAGVLGVVIALLAAPVLMSQSSSSPARIAAHAADRHHAANYEKIAIRHKTTRGEQREVVLPNGARLWLNWNSEVLIAEFDDEIHVDVIIGDVLFTVSEDQERPLVVHAGHAVAHAPHTKFAIHSHGPDDAFFQVKEGVVTITSLNRPDIQELGPLQQSYVFRGEPGEINTANLKSIAAWREGKIVFDKRPLAEVLYELAHYTQRQISVGPIADIGEGISATYALEEADAAVMRLADAYALELVSSSADKILVRSVDRRRL